MTQEPQTMNAADQVIEPEEYDAFLTILWETSCRPGWLIFQTDDWKLSLYVGKQRRAARAAAGLSNIQYRKKIPYRRWHPAHITSVSVVKKVDPITNETGPAIIDPYYDAVNSNEARRLMRDGYTYEELAIVYTQDDIPDPAARIQTALKEATLLARQHNLLAHNL